MKDEEKIKEILRSLKSFGLRPRDVYVGGIIDKNLRIGDVDGDIDLKVSKELSELTIEPSECGWNLEPKTKEGAVLLQAQIDMLGRYPTNDMGVYLGKKSKK